MEIENMVLEALAPEEREEPSAEEIINDNIILQPGALADLLRETRKSLEDVPGCAWEMVSRIVAYNISSSLSRADTRNVLYLLHAEKASAGDQESVSWLQENLLLLEERMRETERERRRSSVVGSFTGAIDYLGEIFREETEERIILLTGAKRPTVKRWMGGGNPQWKNANKVSSLARSAYSLMEEQGWSPEDLRAWLDTPLQSGSSPFELWSESSWMLPLELREELERVGA